MRQFARWATTTSESEHSQAFFFTTQLPPSFSASHVMLLSQPILSIMTRWDTQMIDNSHINVSPEKRYFTRHASKDKSGQWKQSFWSRIERHYMFILLISKSKPVCLICSKTMVISKSSNVQRHYESKHKKQTLEFTSLTDQEEMLEWDIRGAKKTVQFLRNVEIDCHKVGSDCYNVK